MRIRPIVLIVALLGVGLLPVTARVLSPAKAGVRDQVRAGVASVDATWHVGASSGQYAPTRHRMDSDPRPEELFNGEHDPNLHSTKEESSSGVQSRLTIRAIVVEGADNTRIALVKSDNYLAQDQLLRRVGQLLATGRSGITTDRILHTASHNHSSPYYATPAAGVWLFQDVMDLRAFEYQARAMAAAIEKAADGLVPVRMGATTVEYSATQRNAPGTQVADDGTPTGYPTEYNDHGLVVMRFDDITDPAAPKPLAVWMNYAQHPESLDGYNLISADYLGPLERFVDRETGATLVFSQGGVGSAEQPGKDNTARLPDGTVRAFSHAGYAQAERGARQMANAVLDGYRQIGDGGGQVPYSTNFPVGVIDHWVPGPVSHPYPSVSNCRTESTVEGNPGMPILGLPDCERAGETNPNAQTWEQLKALGAPLPEHYDAPSFGTVEENLRLRLQAFRLGEVLLASCACEAQVDLILNFESRANDAEGDIFDGFDWGEFCDPPAADGSRQCANPRANNFADRSLTVSADRFARMQAQVHNDAKGWDDPAYALEANGEPLDPTQIKGNFTKEELPASLGYKLPVGVGHAGDYNGYVVSYRMYMSYDHYRKALTAYGPHTADYMSTRMVRMAGALKGGPVPAPEPLEPLAMVDEARAEAEAIALGAASSAAFDTWDALVPDDHADASVLLEPADVTRFDGAVLTWEGGNPWHDNPNVRVERLEDTRWTPYADQSGEIGTTVEFPKGVVQGQLATLTSSHVWRWRAVFEAFDFFPRTIDPRGPQVPSGEYRFVVDGVQRRGGATRPYQLVSEPFSVRPWDGIMPSDPRVEPGGDVSFVVAPIVYPRTYSSPLKQIVDDGRNKEVCFSCTLRPWARFGEVSRAQVTVHRGDGTVEDVLATLVDGRWVAPARLGPGDSAAVEPGDVLDTYGEINGSSTALVSGSTA